MPEEQNIEFDFKILNSSNVHWKIIFSEECLRSGEHGGQVEVRYKRLNISRIIT